MVHNATQDKLTCSGTLEAADVRVEGTSTTVADLIRNMVAMQQEMAALRQEMAAMKAFVGMMPPPALPPPHLLRHYYHGCFNTLDRVNLGWVSIGTVNIASTGLSDMQSSCAGYTYLSIECPDDGDVNLFCANNLGGIGNELGYGNCEGSPSDTSLNSGSNGHCTGPYIFQGGLPTGGWHRGAVYLTSPAPPAVPPATPGMG